MQDFWYVSLLHEIIIANAQLYRLILDLSNLHLQSISNLNVSHRSTKRELWGLPNMGIQFPAKSLWLVRIRPSLSARFYHGTV